MSCCRVVTKVSHPGFQSQTVKGVLSVSDETGFFTARKSGFDGSSISELSDDTNIFSPQFCLKYPSPKTLFFVSTSNDFFDRFGTPSELRISKKRGLTDALSRSCVGIRIFSHHNFAWNIPLQKHFSRIYDWRMISLPSTPKTEQEFPTENLESCVDLLPVFTGKLFGID